MQNPIQGLWLEGWDHQSIWGYDQGIESFFAQLTRNGNSDADGPDIWITPSPTQPPIRHADRLALKIAGATGVDLAAVVRAMYPAIEGPWPVAK